MSWSSRWFGVPRPIEADDINAFFRIWRICTLALPVGVAAAGLLVWWLADPIIGALIVLGSPLFFLAGRLQLKAYERYWDDRFSGSRRRDG